MYEGSNKVSFADVNLRDCPIRGPPHNPGQGGWPTIRYFNRETGYEGGTYTKVTSKSMCDELGNVDNLKNYVELASGAGAGCQLDDQASCSEKEIKYLTKWQAKDSSDRSAQIDRLINMAGSKMTKDLKDWMNARLNILSQLEDQAEPEAQAEEAAAPEHDEL